MFLSILTFLMAAGPDILVPRPQRVVEKEEVVIFSDKHLKTLVGDRRFVREIKTLNLPVFAESAAYRLDIGRKGVEIVSVTELGVFYALQDLEQMRAVSDTLRCCTITDWPRFSHRGLMLDISRNFRNKDFILKQLDAMALLKLNSLHLHLTDDAGWRIAIDRYPLLTRQAAWRVGGSWSEWCDLGYRYATEGSAGACGGYLTKDDCREIVAYAAERHINVIPEIEIPAHSGEVLAAYPQLSCPTTRDSAGRLIRRVSEVCPGNDAVFEFFFNVLDEVMEVFPSEFIHIGGDEADRSNWRSCPLCRERMRNEGLGDERELQSYVTRRLADYLHSKGRRLLGWDEIIEGGLVEGAAVMAWRDTKTAWAVAAKGHDVILSPSCNYYLDYPQDAPVLEPPAFGVYQPLEKVYAFEPTIAEADAAALPHILGVQGNLWTEFVPSDSHAEYMLYPRAFAVAEAGWSDAGKDYGDFRRRVLVLSETLRDKGYNCFNLASEIGSRPESRGVLQHLALGKKVIYAEGCSAHPRYVSSGEAALTDGLRGDWSYNDGRWQGMTCDLDVTIDLGEMKDIHYVGSTFLCQLTSEVGLPANVEIHLSEDGESFRKVAEILGEVSAKAQQNCSYSTYGTVLNEKARYVRYKAKRRDEAGFAFLFLDEITVN